MSFFQFYPDVFNEPAIQELTHSKKYIAALMLSDARNFYYAGLKKSKKPYLLKKSVRSMVIHYGASHNRQIKEVREHLVANNLIKVMSEGSKRIKGESGNKWELLAIISKKVAVPGTAIDDKVAVPTTAIRGYPVPRKLNKNINTTSPSDSDVDLKKETITWNNKGF